ncbi:hypothetical protein N2W54_001901 [Lotmaria passim]
MYKQRDNELHPPMTSDPSGSGIVSSAITAHYINNDNNNNNSSGHGDTSTVSGVAAGSRKRGRDIRSIARFRAVVYGEDGFRRLHAMVARNPILMYPPEGIDAARARVAERRRASHEQQQRGQVGEDDVFALFEERHLAEESGTVPGAAHTQGEASPPLPSLAALRHDEELATYHHQQLDVYLRLLYEFNHVSFVKLPMEDTLQLLSKCGKEALAHVVEYETQVRLRRQARLKELQELQEEKTALANRRLAAEEAEQGRLLAAAEQRQAELDLAGLDPAARQQYEREHANTSTERVADVNESSSAPAAAAAAAAPQVHFAIDERVKEEKDVKDTDLVETVMSTEVRLPLVGDVESGANDQPVVGRLSQSPNGAL